VGKYAVDRTVADYQSNTSVRGGGSMGVEAGQWRPIISQIYLYSSIKDDSYRGDNITGGGFGVQSHLEMYGAE
jgi:hypothetical protein